MTETLHKKERELYVYMLHRRDTDVSISDMHDHLYGPEDQGWCSTKQQRVGAIVSRVNRKIDKLRIVPGLKLKLSYRLTAV